MHLRIELLISKERVGKSWDILNTISGHEYHQNQSPAYCQESGLVKVNRRQHATSKKHRKCTDKKVDSMYKVCWRSIFLPTSALRKRAQHYFETTGGSGGFFLKLLVMVVAFFLACEDFWNFEARSNVKEVFVLTERQKYKKKNSNWLFVANFCLNRLMSTLIEWFWWYSWPKMVFKMTQEFCTLLGYDQE